MGKILNYLKKTNIQIPISVGKSLARINFSYRPGIGSLYEENKINIENYSKFTETEKEKFIFEKFQKIFLHAYHNVPFYKDLYQNKYNINVSDINEFKDIVKLPIIKKSDLLNTSLENRSYNLKNRLLVNTGGSSGKTFSFYMDPLRYGSEWAHIHNMWGRLNYTPKDLKIIFDARANSKTPVRYDFVRNSLAVNIFEDKNITCKELLRISRKHKISYLHGYPSAIFEFAIFCLEFQPELLKKLQRTLKGAFLSSEYPSPHFRKPIEEIFKIKTQSFYGHTETCVLAVETKPNLYNAFQTYGHAEAVKQKNDKSHLIGTSYNNFASPLIRYDTEDVIEVVSKPTNILEDFYITEGRKGDFILDKNLNRVPLTGLIFGRHHEIFDKCSHIQIFQEQAGKAKVFYITASDLTDELARKYFNSDGIEIDFDFKKLKSPIKSKSGKVGLLLNHDPNLFHDK